MALEQQVDHMKLLLVGYYKKSICNVLHSAFFWWSKIQIKMSGTPSNNTVSGGTITII
jgi:hypothetical protein